MISIRTANINDATEISDLIRSVAHFFTIDPAGSGADRFLETITPESIVGYIDSDEFYYLVTVENEVIIGVGAVKNPSHLYHLFIRESYQGQGIARKLWHSLVPKLTGNPITVNSTVYAVPVYEKFGFKASGPRVEQDGIAFVPMALVRTEV